MPSTKVIRPGQRKAKVSNKPSRAGVSYPLHEFIIPPSDPQGRSFSTSITLPPQMRRVASAIAQHKTLPFQTEQDVMRYCINVGLEKLVEMMKDKEVTSEYSALSSWMASASRQEENLVYSKHQDAIFKQITELESGGHDSKALELAELVWRQADRLSDPYWCRLYRERAKKHLDKLRRKMTKVAEGNGHHR